MSKTGMQTGIAAGTAHDAAARVQGLGRQARSHSEPLQNQLLAMVVVPRRYPIDTPQTGTGSVLRRVNLRAAPDLGRLGGVRPSRAFWLVFGRFENTAGWRPLGRYLLACGCNRVTARCCSAQQRCRRQTGAPCSGSCSGPNRRGLHRPGVDICPGRQATACRPR